MLTKTSNPVLRLLLLAAAVSVASAPGLARGQSPFSHQIPIKLPKGANGMQPELALVYSPGGANGLVGMGWQLTGLSGITRVNYGSGIKYAGTDSCAHTLLGVLVRQADGSYRSKTESFVKLVPSGTCGDGPCSWVAYHPSGARSYYGATSSGAVNGSRLLVQSSASVRTWGLAEVVDPFGNSYQVSYTPDPANPTNTADGQMYPSTIAYTLASNIATWRTVSFSYETRTDVEAGFYQSAFQQTRYRLKWIVVNSGVTASSAGSLLRQYRLDYECGNGLTANGNCVTGRSRLVAVTEYGSNGTNGVPLPPQTFAWQEDPFYASYTGYGLSPPFYPLTNFSGRDGTAPSGWDGGMRVADLDGDGRPDLLLAFFNWGTAYRGAWLNTPTGWTSNVAYTLPTVAQGSIGLPDWAGFAARDSGVPGGYDAGLRLVDLNGDGKPDLVWGIYSAPYAYTMAWINNGNKDCTTPGCAWTPAAGYMLPSVNYKQIVFTERDATSWSGWDAGVRFADVNGDGLPDLVQAYSLDGVSTQNVFLNNGNGWTLSAAFALPASYLVFASRMSGGVSQPRGLQLVDLDSDGRADILYAHSQTGGWVRGAWLNIGSGWTAAAGYLPPIPFTGDFSNNACPTSGSPDLGVRIADVNGDGKPDLLWGWRAHPCPSPNLSSGAWLNSGSGWVADSRYAPPEAFIAETTDNGLRIADVNGDGKPDLVWGLDASRNAWVNGPAGWVQEGRYAPPVAFRAGGADQGVQIVDLSGHGTSEYIQSLYNYGSYVYGEWLRSGIAPDLLASVKNGIGGELVISYESAAMTPGAIAPQGGGFGIPNTAPQQLVASVTSRDGRGGSYTTVYGYYNARVQPGSVQDQRNLGFTWMSMKDLQTGQSTVTYYNQTLDGCEGHVAQVGSYDANGLLAGVKIYDYERRSSTSPPSELCLEGSQTATTYVRGVAGFSQTTATTWDAYGNPSVKTQSADGLPTATVTTQFQNDTANWILGRITDIRTTSGGTALGEVVNVWTGNAITAKKEWLDSTSPPSWIVKKMAYDANGNLVCTAASPGNGLANTTLSYSVTSGCVTSGAPSDIQVSKIEYDTTYRAYPAKVTNALGHVTQSVYNDDGLIKSFTDANNRTTITDYDEFGRKKKETRPDGGTTDYHYVNYGSTSFGYPNGQYMETVTAVEPNPNPPGGTRTATRREYFDGANFKFQTIVTGDCPSTSGGGISGVFTEILKDSKGRPWLTYLPHCEGAPPPGQPARAYSETTYDEMSRVARVTTPDLQATDYSYHTDRTVVSDPNGKTTTRYLDARGNVVSVVDPAGQTTSYGYDALNRLTSVSLPNSQVTSQAWDSLNRETSTTVPLSSSLTLVTSYVYDALGNTTTVTARGRTVTFTYDKLNRVKTKKPGSEATVSCTYDETSRTNPKGRLTTLVDASGTTRFGYTVLGQVQSSTKIVGGTSCTAPASCFTLSYTYDYAGRVKRMTYPDGSYADYAYTDGGEHSEVKLGGPNVPGGTIVVASWPQSQFNAAGKPGHVSYGNGVATDYSYDGMNHLTSLVTAKGGAELQRLTYDWYSRPNTAGLNLGSISDGRANKIAADGSNTDETQSFTHDSLYRLTQDVGVFGTKGFDYDSIGNVKSLGGVADRTLTYDGLLLTSGTAMPSPPGTIWDYTWTVENRLATASRNGILTAQMTYGADGQRAKKVYYPSSGPTVTTLYIGNVYEKRTYSNGVPQLHTIHIYANGQLVATWTRSGNIATAFNNPGEWRNEWARARMYDGGTFMGAVMKAGHLLAAVASHPLVLRWLPLAVFCLLALLLLLAAARSLATSEATGRSRLGLRLAALPVILVFAFTACSGGPAGEAPGSGPRDLGPQARVMIGDTTSGPGVGLFYYHRNHLNSSSVVTDASGAEVSRMVYLPFGELSQANSSGNDKVTSKFTGQEWDAETGLYYYGARYYHPAIGRFLSPDSIVPSATDAQAFNRYAYARDNPITYVDPTGHSFWSFIGGIFNSIFGAIFSVLAVIARAVTWAVNLYVDAVKFIIKGQIFALQIARGMLIAATRNPLAALTIIMAVAAGPPGWVGLAVSIAAQGMAMAAGIRDPQTLGLIGAVAGATTVTALLISAAKYGAGQLVEAGVKGAGGPPWLAAVSSMAMSMAVNEDTADPQASSESDQTSTSSEPVKWDSPSATYAYSQASGGAFIVTDDVGEILLYSPGYSGAPGWSQDNPAWDLYENLGPTPSGHYTIGYGYASNRGNPTFLLTPDAATTAYMGNSRDASSFLIHADYKSMQESFSYLASTGCIILPPSTRTALQGLIKSNGPMPLAVVGY
jgi:RHS repeat-associated protein